MIWSRQTSELQRKLHIGLRLVARRAEDLIESLVVLVPTHVMPTARTRVVMAKVIIPKPRLGACGVIGPHPSRGNRQP
jgi:hypothetical protein